MDQSRETFIKRKDKQKYPICAKSAHKTEISILIKIRVDDL